MHKAILKLISIEISQYNTRINELYYIYNSLRSALYDILT